MCSADSAWRQAAAGDHDVEKIESLIAQRVAARKDKEKRWLS